MSTTIVDLLTIERHIGCMTGEIIAFGRNRRESDFAHIDVAPGRFFIETDKTGSTEWEGLLACLDDRPGLTVAVLSRADLGRGMGQVNAIAAIEAKGATIAVLPPARQSVPPLDAGALTPELERAMCVIWSNSALSEATRLARIAALPGVPRMDKNKVYYICVTKPKRAKRKALPGGEK